MTALLAVGLTLSLVSLSYVDWDTWPPTLHQLSSVVPAVVLGVDLIVRILP